jgi:rfaE bifunctional protein kinase chain/domain
MRPTRWAKARVPWGPWDDFLAAFPSRRVLVVGDVMLDEYLWGKLQRPDAEGVLPGIAVHRRLAVPGGAGNAAANVSALIGMALVAGIVGADGPGEEVRAALAQREVDVSGLLVIPGRPTTTKTRVSAPGCPAIRLDREQTDPLDSDHQEALLAWACAQLPAVHACLLSDYGKGVVTPDLAARFIAAARRAGRPVVVDPKGTDYLKYRGAAVVKPNRAELERLLNRPMSGEEALRAAGEELAARLPGSAVLVTRGADGMALFEDGRPARHWPAAPPPQVVDATGAGDTVAAVLALGLASGMPVAAAAWLANVAAGIVVGKQGTAVVSLEELHDALGRMESAGQCVAKLLPVFYPEGVGQRSPGSRQRTLGKEKPKSACNNPEKVGQGGLLCNPFGVD